MGTHQSGTLMGPASLAGQKAAGGKSQLRRTAPLRELISRMKGHEDGGNVLWTGGGEVRASSNVLPP